jgi:hypothetical protein
VIVVEEEVLPGHGSTEENDGGGDIDREVVAIASDRGRRWTWASPASLTRSSPLDKILLARSEVWYGFGSWVQDAWEMMDHELILVFTEG